MGKIILVYKGINLCKNYIESLGPGRWFNDTMSSYGIQKVLSEYRCDAAKIKLVDPTMTQLLKNYYRKDLVKAILDDIGLADAECILFIVNDHDRPNGFS